jgi:hypothetical protein
VEDKKWTNILKRLSYADLNDYSKIIIETAECKNIPTENVAKIDKLLGAYATYLTKLDIRCNCDCKHFTFPLSQSFYTSCTNIGGKEYCAENYWEQTTIIHQRSKSSSQDGITDLQISIISLAAFILSSFVGSFVTWLSMDDVEDGQLLPSLVTFSEETTLSRRTKMRQTLHISRLSDRSWIRRFLTRKPSAPTGTCLLVMTAFLNPIFSKSNQTRVSI